MKKTFNIKCTMEERWIDSFLSMLRYMEACGKIGHSTLIGFYSDGDGDFRPLFEPIGAPSGITAAAPASIKRLPAYKSGDIYGSTINPSSASI